MRIDEIASDKWLTAIAISNIGPHVAGSLRAEDAATEAEANDRISEIIGRTDEDFFIAWQNGGQSPISDVLDLDDILAEEGGVLWARRERGSDSFYSCEVNRASTDEPEEPLIVVSTEHLRAAMSARREW